MDATAGSLAPLATESQLRIQVDWPFLRPGRAGTRHVGFTAMDLEQLPPQIRALLRALDHAVKGREPAIRGRVENLRAAHPSYTNHQLAQGLIRSTRRRVAATDASSRASFPASRPRVRPRSRLASSRWASASASAPGSTGWR